MFPFLIGKVLTRKEFIMRIINLTQHQATESQAMEFPFLIGKVLTGNRSADK